MMKSRSKIAVIGGGSWGVGIANAVLHLKPLIYTRSLASHTQIQHRVGKADIVITSNISDVADAEVCFVCIPSSGLVDFCNVHAHTLSKIRHFIICTKGFVSHGSNTPIAPYQYFGSYFPESSIHLLSGPNFANEVIQQCKTITTIATQNRDILMNLVQWLFPNQWFEVEVIEDLMGLSILGLCKNPIAIGAGILDIHCDQSHNLRARYFTKILSETRDMLQSRACEVNTIFSAGGIGDIYLSSTSETSRNFTYGQGLALIRAPLNQGSENDSSARPSVASTIEGIASIKAIYELFLRDLNLPIYEALHRCVSDGASIAQFLHAI